MSTVEEHEAEQAAITAAWEANAKKYIIKETIACWVTFSQMREGDQRG